LHPIFRLDQKTQALTEVLTAARVIVLEGPRAESLGSLAPHLSPLQIIEALAAVKAIVDEESRVGALRARGATLFGEVA
jgi:hypothetical protein